jgi:hypothetical protein
MALEFTPYILHLAPALDEGLAMACICKPDLLIMEGGLLGDIDSTRLEGAPILTSLPLIIFRDNEAKNHFGNFNGLLFKLFLNKPFTPLQLHHAIEVALSSELE